VSDWRSASNRRDVVTPCSGAPDDHPKAIEQELLTNADVNSEVESLKARFRKAWLAAHLQRLSPRRAQVIQMWLDDATFEQIATHLNIATSTAKKHFQYAVRDLKQWRDSGDSND
jgi:DnaD/phage-associated family protein